MVNLYEKVIIEVAEDCTGQSLGAEGGITVHAQLFIISHVDEVLYCAIVVDVSLCDRVSIGELDAALTSIDSENLTVHFGVPFA